MLNVLRPPGRLLFHGSFILPSLPRLWGNHKERAMPHIRLGDIAESVGAFLAALGAIRLIPHIKSKVALVRERDAAIAEAIASRAQLLIAEGTVETLRANAEGWREAMERVTGDVERMTGEIQELRSEMRATSAELVDVKHRFAVAVQFIAELIHHGSRTGSIPPIPEALRDDLDGIVQP